MNRKNGFSLIVLASLVCGLGSCAKQPYDDYASGNMSKEAAVEQTASASADEYADLFSEGVSENTVTSSTVGNTTHYTADGKKRQLLKTAQASVEVKDVYKAAMIIEDMTANLGGFVTQNTIENQRTDGYRERTSENTVTIVQEYRPQGSLTVRIPQDKVQTFLRGLVQHIEFIQGRHFDAKDVLLDVIKQQQLARVNAAAARSVGSAAQKGDELGDKVNAIDSKVNYQRSKILADIEKADLADRVAFSTINLQLTQPPLIRKKTEQSFEAVVDQVKPSLWYRIQESFYRGWDAFLSFIVGLVSLWPFFIFFTLLYALWRWVRIWWKARKTKKIGKQESK